MERREDKSRASKADFWFQQCFFIDLLNKSSYLRSALSLRMTCFILGKTGCVTFCTAVSRSLHARFSAGALVQCCVQWAIMDVVSGSWTCSQVGTQPVSNSTPGLRAGFPQWLVRCCAAILSYHIYEFFWNACFHLGLFINIKISCLHCP